MIFVFLCQTFPQEIHTTVVKKNLFIESNLYSYDHWQVILNNENRSMFSRTHYYIFLNHTIEQSWDISELSRKNIFT